MNVNLVTAFFAIGILLGPVAAFAAEGEVDRAHPADFVKDSAITVKIKAKLADEKIKSLLHISVDTDAKGAVVLSGNTPSQAESDKAAAIAKATAGVTSVRNDIVVKKPE
jgi:hyperosmotically inducible periplasmic protein